MCFVVAVSAVLLPYRDRLLKTMEPQHLSILPFPNRVSLFAGVAYFWTLSPPLFPINDVVLGLFEEAVTELNNMDTVLPHKEEKNETKGNASNFISEIVCLCECVSVCLFLFSVLLFFKSSSFPQILHKFVGVSDFHLGCWCDLWLLSDSTCECSRCERFPCRRSSYFRSIFLHLCSYVCLIYIGVVSCVRHKFIPRWISH
jgi:hypothetical protein